MVIRSTYNTTAMLRVKELKPLTGVSRSTTYSQIAEGLHPRPVAIGTRAVGWPLSEIEALNMARIAGKTETEIRALVASMHKARVAGSQ